MSTKPLRALSSIRLSKLTDATTSPERQQEDNKALCAERGFVLVGKVEDLDVSARSLHPFDRPQLGDWLKNRFHEFDVLVVWRMDRVIRNMLDFADLMRWCKEHSKGLVSFKEPFIDLTSPFGEIVAMMAAWAAQMESEAISERNSSAFRHNLKLGKYRGGHTPWGYLPDNSTGEWRLVQDTKQVSVINEVVARVLDGESLNSVAYDLTKRRVPTSQDRLAEFKGREVKGFQWHASRLKWSLTSETLLGHVVTQEPLMDEQGRIRRDSRGRKLFGPKTVLRNEDGSPMVRATPILTREVFDRLTAELKSREVAKEPTKRSCALLLRVIFCGVCGKPMYRFKNRGGSSERYRCASAQYKDTCGNGTVKLAEADDVVTGLVLAMFGRSDRLERVWEAGSDHSAELAELDATLADLTGLVGTGPYRAGTAQRTALDRRIEALADRQAALSAEAVRPAGWVWRSTGEKFKDWWDVQDVQARNVWLRSMGVRLEFDSRPKKTRWHIFFEQMDRMGEHMELAGSGADYARLLNEMRRAGIEGIEMDDESGVKIHWADTAPVV